MELAIIAETAAQAGDSSAMRWCELLSEYKPVEAKAILGRYFWRIGEVDKAYLALEASFIGYREDPWAQPKIMEHALDLAAEISLSDQDRAKKFYFRVLYVEQGILLAIVLSLILHVRHSYRPHST